MVDGVDRLGNGGYVHKMRYVTWISSLWLYFDDQLHDIETSRTRESQGGREEGSRYLVRWRCCRYVIVNLEAHINEGAPLDQSLTTDGFRGI
jgi:hypothetical protein